MDDLPSVSTPIQYPYAPLFCMLRDRRDGFANLCVFASKIRTSLGIQTTVESVDISTKPIK